MLQFIYKQYQVFTCTSFKYGNTMLLLLPNILSQHHNDHFEVKKKIKFDQMTKCE